jgi:hypothetical protein
MRCQVRIRLLAGGSEIRTLKKRRKVGPFSKRLSFAMLDLRTQEGRYARDICNGIAADLGGAPNAGGAPGSDRANSLLYVR